MHTKTTFWYIIKGTTVVLITAIMLFMAPANIQAQDVPVKVEKPKEKKKRIKKKRLKGDKARSNRKQLRQAKYKTRSKQGDKAVKGDITGRKYKPKRTSRKTYARPQPDPYVGRKIKRTGPDRAGPEPLPTFRKPPQGEKPRRGDITGKKRIRTQSASSARRRTYAQPDTRARSATKRGERAGRAVSVTKSVSKPAERGKTISVSRPVSVSGTARIRRKKNPYAGKDRRKGERATDKYIAGRKLRTRGTQSAPGVPRGGYDAPDTYYGRKRAREGGRFSRRTMQTGGYVSGTRKSEQAVRGAGREPSMKNYESPRAKPVRPSFNPYAGRKPLDQGGRFKAKRKPEIRSATRKSERSVRVQVSVPKSVSGRRKISKPKSPYAGREQRRGEQATDRDIAGRKHRTRNFESPRPSWGGAIARPDTYYGRQDRGDRVSKAQIPAYQPSREAFRATQFQGRFRQFQISPGYADRKQSGYQGNIRAKPPISGGGSISGRIWNNKGRAIQGRPPSGETQAATQFQGRFRLYELQPGYGNQRAIGKYQGRFRQYELQPGYGNQRAIGKYQGRFRQYELQPGYGDQRTIGKYQGRFRRFELQPGYANQKAIGKYQGRFRQYELQPGYGDQRAIGKYQGRFRRFELQPGYGNQKAIGKYQGRFRRFELQPGYGNQKAIGKYQGRFRRFELQPGYANQRAIGKYQGRFRPYELQPGYEDQKAIGKYQGRFRQFELQPGFANRNIGRYQGNIKAQRPLKGGGSISGRLWNNKERAIQTKPPSGETQAATQFQGRFRPFDLHPGYLNDRDIGRYKGRFRQFELHPGFADQGSRYQGNIKTRRPLKGGGSISGKLWNNKEKPILTEGQGKETRLATQFQGNLKFRRPSTGGGSVKYKLWNNDEKPVLTEGQGKETRLATQFQGNQKFRKTKTGGGSISYKLWNNNEKPLITKSGGKDAKAATGFEGRFKDYELIYGFSGIESARYGRKKTLPFMKPSQKKNTGYYARVGVTTSRKQMHPSYSYTKSGESKNAAEEKEKTLKFRLWWSNLFKANSNQPDNIKKKERKPRYDKRENDLWYK